MKLVCIASILLAAAAWPAASQSWDSSGNGMLNGTYYFREVAWVVGDYYGDLNQAVALYGSIVFSGAGTYTINAVVMDSNYGIPQSYSTTGTYSISASGHGFLSHPLSSGDFIYGVVSQQGIFVGSATESGFNDLFIAAPNPSPQATVASFKGSYWIADVDLSSGEPVYVTSSLFQLNPDGAGNLGNVTGTGYFGGGGSQLYTQSNSRLTYIFSNGAGVLTFPGSSSSTPFLYGQRYLYISQDGNFVFGGAPNGWDFFVGVRAASGTPGLGGLYYQAGLEEDASQLATTGAGDLVTYYGSLSANAGSIVGHQRIDDVFSSNSYDYTYSGSYTLNPDGTYSSGSARYVVGAGGVRIASGIGPYLGINAALPAPSLSGPGVFLNPEYIENAASFAPATAGIAPGELIYLAGTNLANTAAADATFPMTLGGVQVTINGFPAPVYTVSPGLLTVIVPYGVGSSAIAQIQVVNNGVPSNVATMFVNYTAPGVFLVPSGGNLYGAILHADYTLVTTSSPAQPGETVQVFLTGLGAVNPPIADGAPGPAAVPFSETTNTIASYVGGSQGTVVYSGLAPQLVGLYQLNVTLPTTGLTAGNNSLYVSGPDADNVEAVIPVGGSTTAATPAARPEGRRSVKPAAGVRRPMPCLLTDRSCADTPTAPRSRQ